MTHKSDGAQILEQRTTNEMSTYTTGFIETGQKHMQKWLVGDVPLNVNLGHKVTTRCHSVLLGIAAAAMASSTL